MAASANGGIFLIGKVGAPQEQEALTTPQVSRFWDVCVQGKC